MLLRTIVLEASGPQQHTGVDKEVGTFFVLNISQTYHRIPSGHLIQHYLVSLTQQLAILTNNFRITFNRTTSPPPMGFTRVKPVVPELIEHLLPIKPIQILEDAILRKDDRWAKWPKPSRTSSGFEISNAYEMETFINDIAEAAARVASTSSVVPDTSVSRYWTSGFLDKAVRVAGNGEEVKLPDLVLLDKRIGAKDATWKDVASVMNVVDEKRREQEPELDALSAIYAEHIFNVQPGRRFVPVCLVVEDELQMTIFDRTGPLRYTHIPYLHLDLRNVLIVILWTLFLDRQQLGYDPTLYDKKRESGIEGTFMKVDDVEYEVKIIYHEKIMHGRGTVCWKGVSQVDGSIVVIKDQWADVSKKNKELEILEYLNEGEESSVCTPDGVRVIPKVIASEVIMVRTPKVVNTRKDGNSESVTKSVIQVVDVQDTTALFRSDRKRGVLAHWRIVMAPFASKIQAFPSLKGIATIFKDIVHAIRILHSKGVLHRDISHRNMMWYYHEGSVRGLLVDYDGAVFKRAPFEGDWGTLRYLSLNILITDDTSQPHCYCEDLESLFYVMCFLFTIYDGPCYTLAKLSSDESDNLDVVQWSQNEGKTFGDLYLLKWKSVINCEERVFRHFAPYFKVFKDCMRRLHRLLFRPNNYLHHSSSLRKKYSKRMHALRKRYENCEDEFHAQEVNEKIRIWDRPSELVFRTFLEAFDGVLEELRHREVANETPMDVETESEPQNVEETQAAPVHENTGTEAENATEVKPSSKRPSPQAPLVQSVLLAQNPRKRRASDTENGELERTGIKRNKPLAAPLQPSVAANIPVVEMNQEVQKELRDSKEPLREQRN
ncbi:hypothetical protein SCHPADRAFT_1002164 [Schizopora paradoxa]|uniref:Protein kinase domain-containing protein n=1 Tax=Schizopora paradoxa TaxID=27342 RepID=A0A0H2R4L0_9AGAM|nr:hypothetical protein SCHPADRAFT_1002164 [Schizopora paradoxa]